MPREGSISAVRPEGPKSQRVAICVDGVGSLTVHRSGLKWLQVEAGQTVDVDELRQSVAQAEQRAAVDASFALLAAQDRTAKGLADRLRQRGFAEEARVAAIERVKELGYVDDRRYAAEFVRGRMARRPSGRRALRAELRRKGVESETVEQVLDECFHGMEEAELAAAVVRDRLPRLAKLGANTARRRLVALLQRRGFDSEVIRESVARAMPETDEDVAPSGQ